MLFLCCSYTNAMNESVGAALGDISTWHVLPAVVNSNGDDGSYSRLTIERAAASHALFYSGPGRIECCP